MTLSAATRNALVASPIESFFETLFNPNYARHLTDDLEKAFTVQANYPYNIKRVQDRDSGALRKILLEFAMAGFDRKEISVKVVDDELFIVTGGRQAEESREYAKGLTDIAKEQGVEIDPESIIAPDDEIEDDPEVVYLHHGISKRHLRVSFKLGSKMDRSGIKSTFKDGLLVIEIPAKADETKEIAIG